MVRMIFKMWASAGAALRGEAQHVCERHHQLWHLPVHARNLPAHRRSLPEEPAGHSAVSPASSPLAPPPSPLPPLLPQSGIRHQWRGSSHKFMFNLLLIQFICVFFFSFLPPPLSPPLAIGLHPPSPIPPFPVPHSDQSSGIRMTGE